MTDRNENSSESFEAWIAELSATPALTPKGRTVLAMLRTQPQLSAFASSRQLAAATDVNVGTITRTAQALGYEGWTALQFEFRARYVASLSAVEMSTQHAQHGSTAASSLERDREALNFLSKSLASDVIAAVARAIAEARTTVVVAQGSFAAPGIALAHNAHIAGYDVRHIDNAATLANTLPRLGPKDLLIVINCWHIWRSSVTALEMAVEVGLPTVVMTDSTSSLLSTRSKHQLVVPAEGAGFFPSLVAALAAAQAIVVELARINPARSRASVAASEETWAKFDLLMK